MAKDNSNSQAKAGPPADRSNSEPHRLIVCPGYGSNDLHIGQTEAEVYSFLGKRNRLVRRYNGQYFYEYWRLGIELDFGRRGGRLKYIYFFDKGWRNYNRAQVRTANGITLGSTRSDVVRTMGPEDKILKSSTTISGEYVGESLIYRVGIIFQFSRRNRVRQIMILKRTKAGRFWS